MNGPLLETCRNALQVEIGVLAQSTLLLALGLLAAWLLRGRGPGFRAFLLQVTLAGVALGAVLSVCIAGRVRPVWGVSLPVAQVASASFAAPMPDLDAEESRRAARPVRPAETITPLPTAPMSLPRPPAPAPMPDRRPIVYGVLAGLWAGVTSLLLLWLAACQWHLFRLRHGTQDVTTGLAYETLVRLAAAQAVRPPRLSASPRVLSPFLAGLWQPAIWLPATWEADYDEATLQVILAHELAHHVRRDCAWTLLLRLTCAALWMQPLLWLLARQMEQAGEEACDLMAVSPDCPPRRYADCLLTLAERMLPSPAERMLGASVVPVRSSVGRRIQQVLNPKRFASLSRRLCLILSVVVGVAVVGTVFALGTLLTNEPYFDWAKQQGWSVQPIRVVTLNLPEGLALRLRGYRISLQEQIWVRQCQKYPGIMYLGGPSESDLPGVQSLLATHPHFFYAEYSLSIWYRLHRNNRMADALLTAALHDAPAILAGRCEYGDGKPVVGFRFSTYVSCYTDARTNFGLDFPIVVTDNEGCYYLPVFRGFYRQEGLGWGSEVKGHAVISFPGASSNINLDGQVPRLVEGFVADAHVGVLPPTRLMPFVAMNLPFGNNKGSQGKPLLIHGSYLQLSWKPYPGAAFYMVGLGEYRPSGAMMILSSMTDGKGNLISPLGRHIFGTHCSFALQDSRISLHRDLVYELNLLAFSSSGQELSESDTYYFRPLGALATRPLTRQAILDLLGAKETTTLTSLRENGSVVKVTGATLKDVWSEGGEPSPDPSYVADITDWQIGREVKPGVMAFRMTIQLAPGNHLAP